MLEAHYDHSQGVARECSYIKSTLEGILLGVMNAALFGNH